MGLPKVVVQKVTHESRVHLDVETDDIEAEVARLEKLGAKRVGDVKRWVVMEAPTGQRFCVVRPQRSDFQERVGAGGLSGPQAGLRTKPMPGRPEIALVT